MKRLIIIAGLLSSTVFAQTTTEQVQDADTWAKQTIAGYSGRKANMQDVQYLKDHEQEISILISETEYSLTTARFLRLRPKIRERMGWIQDRTKLSQSDEKIALLKELFRPFDEMGMEPTAYFPEWGELLDGIVESKTPELVSYYNQLGRKDLRSERTNDPARLNKAYWLLNSEFLIHKVATGDALAYNVLQQIASMDISDEEMEKVKTLESVYRKYYKVSYRKPMSYYLANSKKLSAFDIYELLDNRGMTHLMTNVSGKSLIQLGQLIEDLGQYRLSDDQRSELNYYTIKLNVHGDSYTEQVAEADTRSALIGYLLFPNNADLSNELIVKQAMLELYDDIERNDGRMSRKALSTFSRTDVLEFLSINAPFEEIVLFTRNLSKVLDVRESGYARDYYMKPEFESLKQDLREIRGIIKK